MEVRRFGDVSVEVQEDFVARVEIHRPPNNFFDAELISSLADAALQIDADPDARAIVLCAEGKHFCAGANFSGARRDDSDVLYREAVRLFSAETPIVAAIQGAAVGGGLGLALAADFRIATPEARFSANFARLGFHHGFGLSVTLPRLVGQQAALELLFTGRRVSGEEALTLGLCERVVAANDLRDEATRWAAEIAASAPLAVVAIRKTLRGELADEIRRATDHERAEQGRLRQTDDFKEGVAAMAERRAPNFRGR